MQNELEAMSKIVQLLDPLDAAARTRVLAWVTSVLGISERPHGGDDTKSNSVPQTSSEGLSTFSTFAELFHAADPRSEKEKALVAAFWIQKFSGVDQFASQQVNTELKHIGYRVANITDALTQLIADRPSLVIQLAKSGQSKQARKTYKVTDAGFRYMQEMLTRGNI